VKARRAMAVVCRRGVASPHVYWNRELVPEAEVLSFAQPKESTQRKGRPGSATTPALLAFAGGCPTGHPCPDGQRAASMRPPFGPLPPKSAMLSAPQRDSGEFAADPVILLGCVTAPEGMLSEHIGAASEAVKPVARAEHRSGRRSEPAGAPHGGGASAAGPGMGRLPTPSDARSTGHPKGTISGRPFFWVLFFGRAKKRTSPSGARPRFRKSSRRRRHH
jgi:hypothetical protein